MRPSSLSGDRDMFPLLDEIPDGPRSRCELDYHLFACAGDQAFSALPTDNIRYRAYSGWSLFLCDKSKAQEALEHLKPALISLHSSAILHCYATVIQAYLQQWKEAEHRMRTLLHKHNFEQFRSLLWYCKVKSIPDNCWVYRH